MALLLALNGHDVKVATAGREGAEAVSTHRPDVVICDVGLPDLSGFDAHLAKPPDFEELDRLLATVARTMG